MLSEHPRSVFLGQSVACEGTAIRGTLRHLPQEKLVELPVVEALQLGLSTGIALAGGLPISIFARWNFLLLATDQIVNHLDKISLFSNGGYKPRVIIRTAVATSIPLDAGPSHLGDFTDAFCLMCKTIEIVRLETAEQIVPAYQKARDADHSTILVELMERYA